MGLIHNSDGILNIQYNNTIKSICDTNFGIEEASVACWELY